MGLTIGLIVVIISLIHINLYMSIKLFGNWVTTTPAIESMKSINKVYDILGAIVDETQAYKVVISKTRYICSDPYAEMIYDNNVLGEERYNAKYNRVPLDEDVVRELKAVAKGRMIAVNVVDLRDGMKKKLYSSEGIVYSETHKIIMVDQFLFIMIIHYRTPIDNVSDVEVDIIKEYKTKLINIFEENRSRL